MDNERSYALSPLGVELLTKELSQSIRESLSGDFIDGEWSLRELREILRKAKLYHEEEVE